MLKLSFNIKNIQIRLERHYCRGQTVLSFEQNLIEDTDEIKKKVFVKTIKIIVKDNMGQTVLSFDQKRNLLLCFSAQILLKEKRAESDQIKLALL